MLGDHFSQVEEENSSTYFCTGDWLLFAFLAEPPIFNFKKYHLCFFMYLFHPCYVLSESYMVHVYFNCSEISSLRRTSFLEQLCNRSAYKTSTRPPLLSLLSSECLNVSV